MEITKMKKICLPLALSAMATMAAANVHAQSSVTVYGSIDGGLRYQTNVDAAGNGLLSVTSGNYYSNRLGFRGVEDLGGGLKARFILESGFASDTGALDNTNNVLFNRTASVGLSGAWGSVDVGRIYTIAFRTELFLDPFNHHFTPIVPVSSGAGTTLPAAARTAGLTPGASDGTRFNNDIQYAMVSGPLTVRAEYAPGEVAGDGSRGSAAAAGFAYAGGPLLLAGTYTRRETATGFTNRAWVAGGGFKAGATTVKLAHSREQQDAGAVDYRNELTWVGASHNLTPAIDVMLAAYHTRYTGPAGADGKRDLLLLGATYAFSKRTNLYAELDLNRYQGALVPASGQERQRGASLGINHLF
jgi:predicted porin